MFLDIFIASVFLRPRARFLRHFPTLRLCFTFSFGKRWGVLIMDFLSMLSVSAKMIEPILACSYDWQKFMSFFLTVVFVAVYLWFFMVTFTSSNVGKDTERNYLSPRTLRVRKEMGISSS
jgi:hypothetical protein